MCAIYIAYRYISILLYRNAVNPLLTKIIKKRKKDRYKMQSYLNFKYLDIRFIC